MKTTIAPYLFFNGNAAEAVTFYHSILGGKLSLQTYGEANQTQNPADKDRIIHGAVMNEGMMIMVSDATSDQPVTFGKNVNLTIGGSDEAALTEMFNKLAEGGKINMPLEKAFWGDTFGALTDKYGVEWMVNISSAEQST